MTTVTTQQKEKMFCQPDEAYGRTLHTPVTIHLLGRSAALSKAQGKGKPLGSDPRNYALDADISKLEDKDALTAGHNSHQITFLKEYRHQLEKDVIKLQKQLEQQVELHHVLKNAFGQVAAAFSFSHHVPVDAQELLADVAALELAVSSLEDRINALCVELCHEQRERQKVEHRMMGLPSMSLDQQERQKIKSRLSMLSVQDIQQLVDSNSMLASSIPSSFSAGGRCNPSPNLVLHSSKPSCQGLEHILSPSFCDQGSPTMFHGSPNRQRVRSQPLYESDGNCSCQVQNVNLQMSHKLSPEDAIIRGTNSDVQNFWQYPSKLSQEVVNCMISIYRHLASPVDTLSTAKKFSSPTSPYWNNMSSVSSVSESSFLSFKRSPSMDLHNKEMGDEKSFDPYWVSEKIPWEDIGAYKAAIEVCEMCIGNEQLEYAAEALRMFRSLVEQLSRVDPSSMKHEEKLAFWINVYNALMMHAYLAYGVPKNDFKFFSLMQKAAYTVGGHSFNAVVIEHLLLKGKAQWYRPQIALLLAHQKLKLREEVSMFAIDRLEPLVTFCLSFGAHSSPAVRVYSAENVHDELQAAFQDYAHASVGMTSKRKLLIPKLLHDFGRDLVEEGKMLNWICQLLPCAQASIVQQCIKHRHHGFLSSKQFAVIPFDFRFRYLYLIEPNE